MYKSCCVANPFSMQSQRDISIISDIGISFVSIAVIGRQGNRESVALTLPSKPINLSASVSAFLTREAPNIASVNERNPQSESGVGRSRKSGELEEEISRAPSIDVALPQTKHRARQERQSASRAEATPAHSRA